MKSIQHTILCAGKSGTNDTTGTKSTNGTFFNVKYTYVRIGYVAQTRKNIDLNGTKGTNFTNGTNGTIGTNRTNKLCMLSTSD